MPRWFAFCFLLAAAGTASAADVRVRYLVDGKQLRGLSADSLLTYDLASDPACQSVIVSRSVPVSGSLIEVIKPAKLANGPRPKKVARVEQVLGGVLATSTLYVRVRGAQIQASGSDCQQQLASVGGGEVVGSCPPDSERVGEQCMDRYEASAWSVPPSETLLLDRIRAGTVTLADLTGGGAVQRGVVRAVNLGGPSFCDNRYPSTFPRDGAFGAPVYAVSVPGVYPSTCLTAFQAEAACALAGKRLVRTGEFVAAASNQVDTDPDNGMSDCNTAAGDYLPVHTGSRSACVSSDGIHDLIGNVAELTEGSFGSAWARGGHAVTGSATGAFTAVRTDPLIPGAVTGFRCVR